MRRVVMIGSRFDVRGGVSAMASVCRDHGLFDRWGAQYLATHCDGNPALKLAQAATAYARFLGMLALRRVSLLHVHLNSDASFWRKSAFVSAARAAGVPYILHVHCGNFGRFLESRAGAPGRALAGRMLREAAAVIALSPPGADELRRIAPGVPVEVIPNPITLPSGPDTERLSVRHDGARKPSVSDPEGESGSVPGATKPGTGGGDVLFLGMVTEAKGAFDLIRAWAAVASQYPESQLVMAGAGDIEKARELARTLGIEDRVRFPGWVSAHRRDALLARAALFVLPSHAEALPMAVLEAMAAGVPVLATAVGGVPWILEDGRFGALVAPRAPESLARKLDLLLANPERRAAMAEAGRRRVREAFAADVVVPRIEALWARLGAACRTEPEPAIVTSFAPSTGRTTRTGPA